MSDGISCTVSDGISCSVSECLVFMAKSSHFQLYHGETKLYVDELVVL